MILKEVSLLPIRYGALNVQAGTLFCDSDFQKEVGHSSTSNSHMQCCVAQSQPCRLALGLLAALHCECHCSWLEEPHHVCCIVVITITKDSAADGDSGLHRWLLAPCRAAAWTDTPALHWQALQRSTCILGRQKAA